MASTPSPKGQLPRAVTKTRENQPWVGGGARDRPIPENLKSELGTPEQRLNKWDQKNITLGPRHKVQNSEFQEAGPKAGSTRVRYYSVHKVDPEVDSLAVHDHKDLAPAVPHSRLLGPFSWQGMMLDRLLWPSEVTYKCFHNLTEIFHGMDF